MLLYTAGGFFCGRLGDLCAPVALKYLIVCGFNQNTHDHVNGTAPIKSVIEPI